MKHLLKNIAAAKGRFRLRADVDAEDGLTGAPKQGTGGLKLMTVFIAVLGLHVLVIGGITIYHFIKGPAKDAAQAQGDQAAPEAVSPDGATDKPVTADATAPADGAAAPALADGTDASAPSVQTADGSAPATPAPMAASASAPTLKAPVAMPSPVPPAPAPAPVAMAPAPAVSGGAPYVVKSGDTLHKIAATHNTTVAKLKEMNALKSDMLHIGQKLVVGGAPVATAPAAASAPAQAPVVAQASAPAPAAVSAPAVPAAVPGHSYTVVKGDTLTKIAKTFGTSPAAIMAANKLSDPKKLKIGQSLMIPGKSDRHEVSEQKVAPSTLQPQANPDLVMNK